MALTVFLKDALLDDQILSICADSIVYLCRKRRKYNISLRIGKVLIRNITYR